MPITIGSNISSLRTLRRLDDASSARERAFERLSSGSRINRASDDAAGLSIALSLKATSRVSSQAVRNISDGVSFLNIADGATGELKNILIRLRELATQSSNGTFSNVQRSSLDKEAQALQAEYNRVVETAKFNGLSVFGGNISIQAGAGANSVIDVGASSAGSSGFLMGDGTFQAKVAFILGGGTNAKVVTVGDLNGDGILDLATSDGGDNTMSVLLGNGDGTFKARSSFAINGYAGSVALADLNGDGILDMAAGPAGGTNITNVLLGNGDGTFKASKTYTLSANSYNVTLADLNGDDQPDLVTTSASGTISILLGNSDGTFKATTSVSNASFGQSVSVADVNGDGIPDLLTTGFLGTMGVVIGNGDGTFKAQVSFVVGASVNSTSVADLNGDGKLDVVTIDTLGDSTSVLLGNGDGTFEVGRSFVTESTPRIALIGDFNGDSVQDLITVNSGGAASLLLGNGDGTFKAKSSFVAGAFSLSGAVADFNDDGVLDLVTTDNYGGGSISVLLGNGIASSAIGSDLTPLSNISIATRNAALSAQSRIDGYLDEINFVSSSIGVGMSRLAVASANLQSNIEATEAAEARIMDVDVAEESARLVSTGILQQAAAAVLSHANQEPALALALLRP